MQSAVRTGVDELREQLNEVVTSTAIGDSTHHLPDTEQTQVKTITGFICCFALFQGVQLYV